MCRFPLSGSPSLQSARSSRVPDEIERTVPETADAGAGLTDALAVSHQLEVLAEALTGVRTDAMLAMRSHRLGKGPVRPGRSPALGSASG